MKFIIQIIGFIAAGYCFIGTALYLFQEKMLFFPMGSFDECPQMHRYDAKAVESSGLRYYIKASKAADAVIIVFHGNAGSACDRIYFFDLLKGLNADIILFEYPGYGGDRIKPGEKIILKKAVELVELIKQNNGKTRPVYLLGESLGTGVATWVGAQTDVKGLILISAYTSIADVAQAHYPWLPVKYLLRHPFKAFEWAENTDSSVILFHGMKDDIIPIRFGRGQAENFKNQARFIEIKDCGHNDIIDKGGAVLKDEIKQFISTMEQIREISGP